MKIKLPSLIKGNPKLAAQWNYGLNRDKKPEDITLGSKIKFWWKCEKCGKDWEASVKNRNRGSGCPFCTGRRVGDLNSLFFKSENISKEWHPSKNKDLTPQNVSFGSHLKVWWQCEKGHEWIARINDRTNGSGCPYCSGNKVCIDNCLFELKPDLSKEWHPTKNGNLTPKNVTAFSSKKVWWLCKNGHEWTSLVRNRSNGNGCPHCANCGVSNLETRVFTELNEIFGNIKQSDRIGRKEVDILIPDVKIGIEVDGYYWHKNAQSKDLRKNEFMNSKGIKIIRLRESPLEKLSNNDIVFCQSDIRSAIADIVDVIADCKNLDCSFYRESDIFFGDDKYVLRLASQYPKEHRSLEVLFPSVAKEWHPTRNLNLLPKNVSFGSNIKVWWQCIKGHEWEDSVLHRSHGRKCPYCSKRRVSKENCLLIKNPRLSKEWNTGKNIDLTQEGVSVFSGKKVWWKCPFGHEWKAQISSRSNGTGCPVCYREKKKRKKGTTLMNRKKFL